MLLSVFTTAISDAVVKNLVSLYPVMPLLAVRAGIGLAVLGGLGFWRHGFRFFRTRRPVLHAIRMIACFAGPTFSFLALRDLPLADATVIFFSAILFMTALSWPMLGEKVGMHRNLAVIVGFAGLVIVVQPAFTSFGIGTLYAVLCALSYALLIILGRKISDTESTLSLMFFGQLGLLVGCAVFLPSQWAPFAGADILPLISVSLIGLIAHYLLFKAFALAPVGVVAPFEYTGIIWAVLLGYLLFDEVPAPTALAGGALIILSSLYVILRERRESRMAEPGLLSRAPGD